MKLVSLEDLDRVRGGALTADAIDEIIKLRSAQIDALKALRQNPSDKGLLAQESAANKAAADAWKSAMGVGAAPTASAAAPESDAFPSISQFLAHFWD